jgi:hypothetical protein
MRGVYVIVSGCVGSCLQLISYPAGAQSVAIATPPQTVVVTPQTVVVSNTAPLGCTRPECLQLVRAPDGRFVYAYDPNQAPAALSAVVTPTTKSFGGLTLGVGIGATFDTQGQQRVSSATAVNNIVRVSQTNNAGVSFVGESHYFFLPNIPFVTIPAGDWGHGPFVAIDAGTSNNNSVITGYSLGWMIGFRAIDPTTGTYSTTSSWNFGVGFRVDPNAQVLGDGLTANAPLPPGDTVRLKTEARYGIMLLSSFSF